MELKPEPYIARILNKYRADQLVLLNPSRQVIAAVVVERPVAAAEDSSSSSSSSSSSESSSDDERKATDVATHFAVVVPDTASEELDVSSSDEDEDEDEAVQDADFVAVVVSGSTVPEALDDVLSLGTHSISKQDIADAMFDSETIKESPADLVFYTAESRRNAPVQDDVLFEAIPVGYAGVDHAHLERVALRKHHDDDHAFAGMHIDDLFQNAIVAHVPTADDPTELSIVCRPTFSMRNLGRLATLVTAPKSMSFREFKEIAEWIQKMHALDPNIRFEVSSPRAVLFLRRAIPQLGSPELGKSLVLHGGSELDEFHHLMRQYGEALLLDWLFGTGRATRSTPPWGTILLMFAFLHVAAMHKQRARRTQEWLGTAVYDNGVVFEHGKATYEEFKEGLKNAATSVSNSVQSAWKNVSEYTGRQYDAAKAYLSNPEFKAKLSTYAQQVADSISSTYESLKANAGVAYDKLSKSLGSAYDQVKVKSKQAYARVNEALKNVPQWTAAAKAYLVSKADEAKAALARIPESERWQAIKRKLSEWQKQASEAGEDLQAYVQAKYEDWKQKYDEWSNRPSESSQSADSSVDEAEEARQIQLDNARVSRERRERDEELGIPASLDEAVSRPPRPVPPRNSLESVILKTAVGEAVDEAKVEEAHEFIDKVEHKGVESADEATYASPIPPLPPTYPIYRVSKTFEDDRQTRLLEEDRVQRNKRARPAATIEQEDFVAIPPTRSERFNEDYWKKRETPISRDPQEQIISDMRKEDQDTLAYMSSASHNLYNPGVVAGKIRALGVLQNGLPHPESLVAITDHLDLLRNVPQTQAELSARTTFISKQLELCHMIMEKAAFDPILSADGSVDYEAALDSLEKSGAITYEQTFHLMEFLDFVVANHLDIAAQRGTDFYDQVRKNAAAGFKVWQSCTERNGSEMRTLGGSSLRLVANASTPDNITLLLLDPKRRVIRASRAVSIRFSIGCYNGVLTTALDECMREVDASANSRSDPAQVINGFIRKRLNSFSGPQKELGEDMLLFTQYLHALGAVLVLPSSSSPEYMSNRDLLGRWNDTPMAHCKVWWFLRTVIARVVDQQLKRPAAFREDELDAGLIQDELARSLGGDIADDTAGILMADFGVSPRGVGFLLHQFLMDLNPITLEWNDVTLVDIHHSLVARVGVLGARSTVTPVKSLPAVVVGSPQWTVDHNMRKLQHAARLLPFTWRYDTPQALVIRERLLFDIGVARIICSSYPNETGVYIDDWSTCIFGSVDAQSYVTYHNGLFELPEPDESLALDQLNDFGSIDDDLPPELLEQSAWNPNERKSARVGKQPFHLQSNFILPSMKPLRPSSVASPSYAEFHAVLRDVQRCYSWEQVAHVYKHYGIPLAAC